MFNVYRNDHLQIRFSVEIGCASIRDFTECKEPDTKMCTFLHFSRKIQVFLDRFYCTVQNLLLKSLINYSISLSFVCDPKLSGTSASNVTCDKCATYKAQSRQIKIQLSNNQYFIMHFKPSTTVYSR